MDTDDLFPPKRAEGITLGEDISRLSIVELDARIQALEAEIARVEAEKEAKQSFRDAAENAFKS